MDLPNYTTNNWLNDATGFDTSNLAVKRGFVALKAEVDKLDIIKLVKVSTGLSNLKTKVGDLDAYKLQTGHVDLKK